MKKKIPFLLFATLFATTFTTLGACAVADGDSTEPAQSTGASTDDENVTIKDFEISSQPLKTAYLPGEIFDPSGLVVKATLSNGKKKKFRDSSFETYTHKNEPLTEDVTKITFTFPGYETTFDIAITVGFSSSTTLDLDLGRINKPAFYSDETIDFSKLKVRVKDGDDFKELTLGQWKLFEGDNEITDITAVKLGAGSHTLTVKYMSLTSTFTLKIVDKEATVYPALIEAEDNVYLYETSDTNYKDLTNFKETENRMTDKKLTFTSAQWANDDGKIPNENGTNILAGTSGSGASDGFVHNNSDYYWKRAFFKFEVNAPEAGEYDLYARGQTSGAVIPVSQVFSYNINGEKGTYTKNIPAQVNRKWVDNGWQEEIVEEAYDATYEYEYRDSTSADKFYPGNQLDQYYGVNVHWDETGYRGWCNQFWWNDAKIETISLKKGKNVIRLNMNMPNGDGGFVLDAFRVVEKDSFSKDNNVEILNLRNNVALDENGKPTSTLNNEQMLVFGENDKIYLSEGEKLSDISSTPVKHPCHYTLMYLRLPSGKELPITEEMISGLDYNKKGEQTATVTAKDPLNKGQDTEETKTYTTTFKVVIE